MMGSGCMGLADNMSTTTRGACLTTTEGSPDGERRDDGEWERRES